MKRVDIPELLDSDACSPEDVQASLRDIGRVNRWFGGVATTQKLIGGVVEATGLRHFSLLEVAAGTGEVSEIVRENLARSGITLDIRLLDRAWSHLPKCGGAIVADALALPFRDAAFDLVSCNLFVHHLDPEALARFVREAIRVSRRAALISDLVRNPLHLALVYAGFPLMRSPISRADGVASVRRAYTPGELQQIISSAADPAPRVDISGHFLFRMGAIVWKEAIAD
ncbi:MAG: methyltransferase domain-containing protein [Candidatus Sulfotelmatobacter sp.]